MADDKKADSTPSSNSDGSPPPAVPASTTTSYQSVPTTPTQSKGKAKKPPRYLRSASIQLLTHPVDKSIAWSFFVSVVFAAVSVLTGFPTVLVLLWAVYVALGARLCLAYCCGYRRHARAARDRDEEEAFREVDSPLCPVARDFVRAPEALWLHDSRFNLHVAHSLFWVEGELGCARLRDMLRARVLNKTNHRGERAFPRLLQRVVAVCSGYCWVEDADFSLDNHVYEDPGGAGLDSDAQLEEYVGRLMAEPLPPARPLWEIRVVPRPRDTLLVVRVHQAVSDAVSLVAILCNHLSDNEQFVRLKARFGAATFLLNAFRAVFVAPLTFLGWLVCRRRDCNLLRRGGRAARRGGGRRAVAWSRGRGIRLAKALRVKQVMRCSLNDVFVSAVTGAVRAHFARHGIRNPPNVTLTLPVDLRDEPSNALGAAVPAMGCRFSPVNVRLPSNTEGAIPRLWDVRRRMEELKTSPDTVVMYGAIHCLLPILPEFVSHWLLNTVLRKATVLLANVPGPDDVLMLGSKRLKKMTFWMSPRVEVPLVFSVLSYAGTVQVSVSADKAVVPQPHVLVQEFSREINRLSRLLARRRIPGEHRRRSHFSEERRIAEILNPTDAELQRKLYATQERIHSVTQMVTESTKEGVPRGTHRPPDPRLVRKLEELKEEFSELLRELRRRKSLADGIVPNNQDEDLDGELRRPRRLTLPGASRRASLSAMLASTSRPLSAPSIAQHGFVASTPNLQAAAGSPTFPQQRASFLQVAQERFGRRKSDFN